MSPLAYLLVLTLYGGSTGVPINHTVAYFASQSLCDAAGDALRGPYETAKCFPTGAGGMMSRVTEDADRGRTWSDDVLTVMDGSK